MATKGKPNIEQNSVYDETAAATFEICNDPLSVPFQGQVEEDRSGRKYFLRDSRAWGYSGELEYQFHRTLMRKSMSTSSRPDASTMTRVARCSQVKWDIRRIGIRSRSRVVVAGSTSFETSNPVENLCSITL